MGGGETSAKTFPPSMLVVDGRLLTVKILLDPSRLLLLLCHCAAKVEKRHVELDRLDRRLDALHGVRPAQVNF